MRESLESDPSTGLKIIDPIKLSARIQEKGTTVDKLFKGELDELRQVLNVLDRGKANLAPEVVESLRNLPLGQGLLKLRQTQRALSQRKQDQFTQILQSTNNPDVLAANVFSDVASIKRARRVLNPNTFQSVQDAAMGRILKQIGATVDDRGAVVMTDDFVDAFIKQKFLYIFLFFCHPYKFFLWTVYWGSQFPSYFAIYLHCNFHRSFLKRKVIYFGPT